MRWKAAAFLALILYAMVSRMAFDNWRAQREATAMVAHVQEFRQVHGQLPEDEDELGFDPAHAFYEKKTPARYVVDYFGFLA